MNQSFGSEFANAARQAPRIFFAPLMGAVAAIKDEFRRVKYGADQNSKPLQSK
ncbi:TPA: hypothetical protein ACNV18_001804 [Pseudomonas putida]|jgi:hypothetical protein|uniref:Uncharacterized protein n=2 Tax=Pseudomonas TaxID=286 RepID=A0A6B7Q2J0_9PSED|nr:MULTISPECIES: hypothetical protein [Pseudomonas]AGZ38176.1 hypothetical protein PVLB_27197 [Pseudomonas sp. VLB120]EKT4484140.1 hypothetical protein [Pseudomonas putida]MBA6061786.1 hypothetical protein [Pseudomonas juntendi]MCE0946117.1 hypothetical protein [Pseudomonas asiatica]MCE1004269.1 hypothetical protein [Pseudomonas sp. NMI1173_11]